MGSGVHRLHGGVGLERHFIVGLDFLLRAGENLVNIALISRNHAGRTCGLLAKLLLQTGGALLRARAFVPGNLQRLSALKRGPGATRHHGNAAGYVQVAVDSRQKTDRRNSKDRFHSRGSFCRGAIAAYQLAAEVRAASDHRVEHPGNTNIDAEDGRAVDLAGRVNAPHWFADESEILRILQRNLIQVHLGNCRRPLY